MLHQPIEATAFTGSWTLLPPKCARIGRTRTRLYADVQIPSTEPYIDREFSSVIHL